MLLRGKPVSGVGLQVGDYVLQARTTAGGQFNYRADTTLPERHVATVTNVKLAKVGGKPLSDADKSALLGTRGGFSVGYKVTGLHTSRGAGGNVVLTGRARLRIRQAGARRSRSTPTSCRARSRTPRASPWSVRSS